MLLLSINTAFTDRNIWYVHPDSALNSIQAALDSCDNYDTVLVAPSTYHEHISWPGRSGIRLISEQGPDVTIIDADNNYRVLTLATGLDTFTTIDGFTITGGATGGSGGGILCNDNSQPLIQNNIIKDNTATDGGGIFVLSSAIIRNNKITQNGAVNGGGICCAANTSAMIYNNKILHNLGAGFPGMGGGIFVNTGSSEIFNNKIIGNEGYVGGGICCFDTNSTIFIMNNTLDSNSALWAGGGLYCTGAPNIIDNIFTQNTADYGGGLVYWYQNAAPTILQNIMRENTAVYGGAISDARWTGEFCLFDLSESEYIARNSTPVIERTMFIANTGNTGAAICCIWNTHPQIEACTFLDNNGDAIFCDSLSNPIIHNSNISGSGGFAVNNKSSSVILNAEYNWWGDSTGPYHPDSNPGGLGDSVSDYVDFIPWLYSPGVEEQPTIGSIVKPNTIGATIFAGPLQLPIDKTCRVFDITGRVVVPEKIKPGIYFIEVEGKITEKAVKIK